MATTERLKGILFEGIRNDIQDSDAEVGLLLSGGIDSASLLFLLLENIEFRALIGGLSYGRLSAGDVVLESGLGRGIEFCVERFRGGLGRLRYGLLERG